MKQIRTFTLALAFVVSAMPLTKAVAQHHWKSNGKQYVEAFDDGRVLTPIDIRFLNSITGNGNDAHTAVVLGKKYKAGQRLTNDEAAALNFEKSNFRHKHKLERAEDGRAIDRSHYQSCDWYLYSDGNNSYYVWYCD